MSTEPPKPTVQHRGLAAIPMWSIDHPYVILAAWIGIAVLAVLAIGFLMPRRFMPYVESPVVGVFTMMPGLSAQEMELYITNPIEQQMTNIRGVHYIRSSSQDGFSVVSLEFWYGSDMRKALFDVQSLMNLVQGNLPITGANLKPSWVLAIDPLNIPVLSLSVTGEGWDPVKLREFADNQVVARLKQQVPDVYSVMAFGGYRRQLQVIVDREKLGAYGLSILDVRKAIDGYNVARPAGTLTNGADEQIVRVDSRAQDAAMVAGYPLTALGRSGEALGPAASPRVIRIKDVARVVDTHWERRSAYHHLRHEPGTEGAIVPSIEIAVVQNPEASSWKVIRSCRTVLKQLEADYPGIHFDVAYDNAHFVDILFGNMFHELGMAVLLCGMAVFLFLGEWRGTVIVLVSIPTSLAMAMLLMIPLGMTLNSGTLIGLLLSIGRLVDDSIIDIHAVERHLRMGKSVRDATVDGIAEVRLAVLASTFMICLALAPLLFCGGIVELMFVELVWPLLLALLASMVESFTTTALMCNAFLRPAAAREAERRTLFFRGFINPFQAFLDRTERGYERAIRWMLKHRFVNFARIMATVIVGFTFYHFIGSEMMPLADVGQAYGVLEMQPGTSFEATEAAATQVERIMLKYPEIENVSSEIGTETMLESSGTYFTGYAVPMVTSATFMMTFSDMSERKRDIWEIMDGVQKEATETIPGIRRLQIKEMGSDVMATSQAPIALIIYGHDLQVLDRLGQETLEIAKRRNVYQPATDWTMGLPSYRIEVDPERAQQVGLSAFEIAQQAYYSLKGGFTDEFYRLPNIRQNTILVRYEESERATPRDLAKMYVTTRDGRQVPLDSVARLVHEPTPSVIVHDGLRRIISVLGFYRPGERPSMDLTMDVQMDAMMELNFPPGYGIDARGDMTQMMDSFRRLLNGLMLAVIFILLILVAQFRGFLQPLQMAFSLPLELSGVFFMLWLTHQTFSTVSVLGIIVVTGMDATTAVLLVDMIMRYRDRGVDRDEAIARACPQRLRPILMTSVITIIVMIPVAFFPGTGMDAYSPLAAAVIGGLVVGTILSLFDIPIMHSYVDDVQKLFYRYILRREWKWPVTASPDDGMIEL